MSAAAVSYNYCFFLSCDVLVTLCFFQINAGDGSSGGQVILGVEALRRLGV